MFLRPFSPRFITLTSFVLATIAFALALARFPANEWLLVPLGICLGFVVIGVNDLVLVETDDAILLCPRSRSQDVSKIVKWLEEKKQKSLL